MNRKDRKCLDSFLILFERGWGEPGCDEGRILTQEPEKEITFAQCQTALFYIITNTIATL